MKLLVSGGNGLIGRPLVGWLTKNGITVVAPERGEADLLEPEGRERFVSLGKGATHLVHLAWTTEHGKFWESPQNNVWRDASLDLFDRFYAGGGERITGVGTCAEYDWDHVGASPVPETAPLAPASLYGKTKADAAEALFGLAQRYGGSAAWCRTFWLFGPGEDNRRLVPAMIQSALSGTPMDCGPAGSVRDFWDVRNVGAAIATIAVSDLSGPVNVASGRPTTLGDIGSGIERLTGRQALFRYGQRMRAAAEPSCFFADTRLLREKTGFREQIGLAQGLADYVQWSMKTSGET